MTPLPEPQAGASARPWRNVDGEIFDRAGNEIARVWDKPVYTEGRANAALIIQAVNSFEALVAALTTLRAKFHRALVVGGTDPEFADVACEQADAALRLAAPAPESRP